MTTPRTEHLRRRLQTLKIQAEMARIEDKMSGIKESAVPNILLLRLLDLERQHLEVIREMIHSLPLPRTRQVVKLQSVNDNVLRVV